MSGVDWDAEAEPDAAVRISGRVKWFDPGKGYGFIVPDEPAHTDSKDVLLHVTCLRDSGRDHAPEGALHRMRCGEALEGLAGVDDPRLRRQHRPPLR